MRNINSTEQSGGFYVYGDRNSYVSEVKDTFVSRLEREQTRLMGILRGREVHRFNSAYEEIIHKINAEEI